VLEEGGDASEEADALDASCFGLIEEGADEQAAGSVPFGVGADDDGANLGEMLSIDVEGGAANELAEFGFNDGESADVRADLRVTPGEQSAVVGEAVDKLVDGAGVPQLRFARLQGCCCELVFRWDEGDYE